MPEGKIAETIVADQTRISTASPLLTAVELSMNSFGNLTAQSRRNLKAAVASATAVTDGVKSLSDQAVSSGKSLLEAQSAAAQKMLAVRSLKDLFALQSSYASATLETCTAEATKASATISALLHDAFSPFRGERETTAEDAR